MIFSLKKQRVVSRAALIAERFSRAIESLTRGTPKASLSRTATFSDLNDVFETQTIIVACIVAVFNALLVIYAKWKGSSLGNTIFTASSEACAASAACPAAGMSLIAPKDIAAEGPALVSSTVDKAGNIYIPLQQKERPHL